MAEQRFVDWDGLVYYDSKIKDFIGDLAEGMLKVGGFVTFEELPSPSFNNLNFIYKITDSFTSDDEFNDPGYVYKAGTWVQCSNIGGLYLYTIFNEEELDAEVLATIKEHGDTLAELEVDIQEVEGTVGGLTTDLRNVKRRVTAIENVVEDLPSKASVESVNEVSQRVSNLEGQLDALDIVTPDELTIALTDVRADIPDVSGYATKADLSKVETQIPSDYISFDTFNSYVDQVSKTYPTKTSVENSLSTKADKAATLSGYGIKDAYTKTEVNTLIANATLPEGTLEGYVTEAELSDKVDEVKAYIDDQDTQLNASITSISDSITDLSDDVDTRISNVLTEAKEYADAQDADTIYDDTQVKADIKVNSDAIVAEKTRAEAAEATVLQDAKNYADSLGNNYDESGSAAYVLEQATQLVNTETNRALAAEQSNTKAINTEKTRAEAAEANLNTLIQNLSTLVDSKANDILWTETASTTITVGKLAEGTDISNWSMAEILKTILGVSNQLVVYPTSIQLNMNSASLKVGETIQLIADVKPDNANMYTEVVFNSNDPSIASVDADTGLITANKAGNAIIVAATNQGKVTSNCTIMVTALTIVDTIIAEEIPMYAINDEGQVSEIPFKLTTYNDEETFNTDIISDVNGFYQVKDSEGNLIESGYQLIAAEYADAPEVLALPKPLTLKDIIVKTYDTLSSSWVEVSLDYDFVLGTNDDLVNYGLVVDPTLFDTYNVYYKPNGGASGASYRFVIKE